MTPEHQRLKQEILNAALQLDAELPNSPIAQLVAYRARRVFTTELSEEGKFTLDGVHEINLLVAVMHEQIQLM